MRASYELVLASKLLFDMLNRPDWRIVSSYLLLGAISLTVLFSIAPERLVSQAIFLLLGLIVLLYLSSQDSNVYESFVPLTYGLAIFMLMATLILGEDVRGSTRWIDILGFRFQASEFTKPLLILSFAYFLDRYPPRSLLNLAKNIGLLAIPALLIFRQPDLGTALVVGAIWLAQLIIAGPKWWAVLSGLLIMGFAAKLSPLYLHGYQLERLESFVDPSVDPLGSGYNVIQSIVAVGSGGLFGKGLGHGTQSHLRFLPERHTDFIFASLAEELGFAGAAVVITLLSIILFRLLSIMLSTKPRQSRLVLAGIFSFLAFQTFLNIGMNIGIAPVTGITLPLISSGGSSILSTAICLGIASSISRKSKLSPLIEIK